MAASKSTGGGAADPAAIGHHGHTMQFQDFVDAIRKDRTPAIDGHEGRRSVEIILAIYKSAQTGKKVTLPLKSDPKLAERRRPWRNRPLSLSCKIPHNTRRFHGRNVAAVNRTKPIVDFAAYLAVRVVGLPHPGRAAGDVPGLGAAPRLAACGTSCGCGGRSSRRICRPPSRSRRRAERQAIALGMWEHLLVMVCEIAHAPRKIHRTNWRSPLAHSRRWR